MSAFTCRLPEDLQQSAAQAAKGAGLSLNAFVALALRHYLDHGSEGRPRSAAGVSRRPEPDGPPALDSRGSVEKDPLERFTCPRRFRPFGILGADYLTEYRRSIDYHWYREHDPRRIQGDYGRRDDADNHQVNKAVARKPGHRQQGPFKRREVAA